MCYQHSTLFTPRLDRVELPFLNEFGVRVRILMRKQRIMTTIAVAVICSVTMSTTVEGADDVPVAAEVRFSLPHLKTNDQSVNEAFRTAVGDLVGNVMPMHRGLLEKRARVIFAGLHYNSPWARDASVNASNGTGLILPQETRNSLLAVVRETDRGPMVHHHQYWDLVVWVTGSWDYYLHVLNLTKHAVRDRQFAELYHPVSGEIYGGLQENNRPGRPPGIIEWDSQPQQTWAATSYLRMVFQGLLGMRFDETGVTFAPCVPPEIDRVELEGLRYRDMTLAVSTKGSGTRISKFLVNGEVRDKRRVEAGEEGTVEIRIVMEND
jgi:glycogen debranching enzyme